MRQTLRMLALAWLAAALPAAADSSRVQPTMDWLPAGIDWRQAETLLIKLGDFSFEPDDIELVADRPYRVILDNTSETSTHDFVQLELFHAIVFAKIDVDGIDVITPHIHEIKLRPNTKATLYLVPKKAGSYEVFCSVPGHLEEGMEGLVTIVPGAQSPAVKPAAH